jgi:hypothetical protein
MKHDGEAAASRDLGLWLRLLVCSSNSNSMMIAPHFILTLFFFRDVLALLLFLASRDVVVYSCASEPRRCLALPAPRPRYPCLHLCQSRRIAATTAHPFLLFIGTAAHCLVGAAALVPSPSHRFSNVAKSCVVRIPPCLLFQYLLSNFPLLCLSCFTLKWLE